MIKKLKNINKKEADLFGGKAANLGFIIQNRINVPEGFCISTDVNKLNEITKKKILDKFRDLKSPVAVRSSATCEDSKKFSFAGQFDTALNVNNEKLLFDSIEKCWDSLYSDRVKAYNKSTGIKSMKMAVIVQKMIDAEYSGVIFTKSPFDNRNMVIEIITGLGDKLVSGEIIPSKFIVNRNSLRIIRKKNIHNIYEKLIEQVGCIGLKIEKIFDNYQDIEFSVLNGEVYVLQARPVTGLN